jgi:hypothetical protein
MEHRGPPSGARPERSRNDDCDGIEEERKRCIDLLRAAIGRDFEVPTFMVDPGHQW